MRQVVAGGAGAWFITKLMLFNEYVENVGGIGNVDWSEVITAACLIGIDGLIAIGALKTPPQDKPEPAKELDDFEHLAEPLIDLAQLRHELMRDEGYRDYTYLDTEGNLTGGIGHLITADDAELGLPVGAAIPEARIESWYLSDTGQAISDARSIFDDFESHPIKVRHALVNMAFNLGHERLSGFRKTIALINKRQYAQAADEALNSKWATQVGARAQRIAKVLRMANKHIVLA